MNEPVVARRGARLEIHVPVMKAKTSKGPMKSSGLSPSDKPGKLVRIAGLEPARITPLPPQSSASANSAICARVGRFVPTTCDRPTRGRFGYSGGLVKLAGPFVRQGEHLDTAPGAQSIALLDRRLRTGARGSMEWWSDGVAECCPNTPSLRYSGIRD